MCQVWRRPGSASGSGLPLVVVVTRCHLATLVSAPATMPMPMRSECDEQRSGTANPGQTTLTLLPACQPASSSSDSSSSDSASSSISSSTREMRRLITKFTKTSHTHTMLFLSICVCVCVFIAALSLPSASVSEKEGERASAGKRESEWRRATKRRPQRCVYVT